MNREQMIEKAAEVHAALDWDPAAWGDLSDRGRDHYRGTAQTVLDAILPQVTTAEEVKSLPVGTYLLGADGTAWEHVEPADYRWRGTWRGMDRQSHRSCQSHHGDERLLDHGPLTVVWTP